MLQALAAIGLVLKHPAPAVHTLDFADSSVRYLIRYYLADYADLLPSQGEIHSRLWYRFGRAGIEILAPAKRAGPAF